MSLNEKLTALATSIRTKSGVSGSLSLDAMKTAVDSITTGGGGGSSDDEEWYQEPPNDGKTRLYIDVAQEHRKDISIKSCLVNGTESNDKYIDWGDGSSDRISAYRISREHTYQKLGKYIITINAPTNSISFDSLGYYESSSNLREKVRKIYLGTDISSTSTIGTCAAAALLSLNIGECRATIDNYFLCSYILNQDTLDLSQNDFYKTDYEYIFYQGVPTINTYKLPKNITTMGNYKQVYGNYVYFPSGLTSIGRFLNVGADYRDKIKELHFASTTPPTIQADTFGYSDYAYNSTCKIIVPVGCGEAYKAATNWAKYANQIVEETTNA